MSLQGYDPDDDEKPAAGGKRRFAEYDCPDCNANNPAEPPVVDGDEVTCHYCGASFVVKVDDEGRMKLRST